MRSETTRRLAADTEPGLGWWGHAHHHAVI